MPTINKLTLFGTKTSQEQFTEKENGLSAEVTTYELLPQTRNAENLPEGAGNIPIDFTNPKYEKSLIELVLEDGSSWMLDQHTLHEAFPQIDPRNPNNAKREGKLDEFVLPATLGTTGTERGMVGSLIIKVVKHYTKIAIGKGLNALAVILENKSLKEKGGLFPLKTDFGMGESISQDFNWNTNKPYLLLIHGTLSNTNGAFGKLKDSNAWKVMQQIYGDRIIAFEHRTLTQSPLQNVVELAEKLPKDIELHLITHSRGGIVGDILSRYNPKNQIRGFSDGQTNYLENVAKGREQDIEAIEQLDKILGDKNIAVTQFIRVACPAAGTTLLSQRLDTYLNVLFNLLGQGTLSTMVQTLVMAALYQKENPEALPGLEAQMPESPFLKVLNYPAPETVIKEQSLIVLSGNTQKSASFRGIWAILSRLFFWKRNDLVVDTESMYLGALRNKEIQYFFDEGPHLDHFKFFSRQNTTSALELALTTPTGSKIPGFEATPQIAVPPEHRALLDHGELKNEKEPSGKRPIVVLLPGIMGSNLYRQDREIWLHYGRLITGELKELDINDPSPLEAKSVVKTSYHKLHRHLSKTYDVLLFPFDWRKPLSEAATDFNAKIQDLLKLGQPIKIIGHSMGGVLVRDFILDHGDTWEKLNTSLGFQLIFLGSPLKGSHRILSVLFGKDSIINKLAFFDLSHSKEGLVQIFKKFPGLLGLLPLKLEDGDEDYSDIQVWQKIRQIHDSGWPIPEEEDLGDFDVYQKKIKDGISQIDYSNCSYIAGWDECTPYGYYLHQQPPHKLYFLYTAQGDQSVTWELGIPKEMDADSVYYTRASHGDLARDPALFPGIDEILENGSTQLLSTARPAVRSADHDNFWEEPPIDFDFSEEGLFNTLLGHRPNRERHAPSQLPLTVSISKGHLKYSTYPLLAGHFNGDSILYAEKAIDRSMDGALRNRHHLDLYPGEIGTFHHFPANKDMDFEGAIILGMGEQGKLTSHRLAQSVEKGVLDYLMEQGKTSTAHKNLGLSSLLICSGYGGLSIESSINGILEGIANANRKIQNTFSNGHPTVQHVEFIELFSDRALQCMHTLRRIIAREDGTTPLRMGNLTIKKLLGYRNRIPLDEAADWWNRISVRYRRGTDPNIPDSFVFNVGTGDSRQEERELFNSGSEIDHFIAAISTRNEWNRDYAKTLFELLIPNTFKDRLKQKGNISLILDIDTAAYPWELLQDNTLGAKPLCINAGMVRQLATRNTVGPINRPNNHLALVVADPNTQGFLRQLPGALREGEAVANLLAQNHNYNVTTLIGSDPIAITPALYSKEYRIVHLAGHGIYKPEVPSESGMVIGKEQFLTVSRIQQLSYVPDLVFVNCCHLGHADGGDERFHRDRYRLAANLGIALINKGVKAVVAAGWAVNDAAALQFATTFYNEMLGGKTFGDAVKTARNTIYEKFPETNTWGAYQCYGDPFFTLKEYSKGKFRPHYIVQREVEVDLENLFNDMQIGFGTPERFREKLETIIQAAKKSVSINPAIREKIAEIYQEMGDYAKARFHYGLLLEEEKAEFSLLAMEKYCNISSKQFVKEFLSDRPLDESKHQKIISNENSSSTEIESLWDSHTRNDEAHKKIRDIIDDLTFLLNSGRTAERLNLVGSAYKRLALVCHSSDWINALKRAQEHYEAAYKHPKNTNTSYSLTNALEIALILAKAQDNLGLKSTLLLEGPVPIPMGETKNETLDLLALEKEKYELTSQNAHELDYWNMVAWGNLEMTRLLLAVTKEDEPWRVLADHFDRLWKKAGSPAKKKAEMEQLQFLVLSLYHANNYSDGSYIPWNDGRYKELVRETSDVPEDLSSSIQLLKKVL